MRKLLLGLLLFGLGIGGAVIVTKPAGAQTQAVDGTLTGSVGSSGSPNAYVISLSATSVPAGTYEFDITDYATIHDFDLLSPGGTSIRSTTVAGTGSATWTVALSPGVYTFRCDVHSDVMSGTLTVTSGTTSTDTTTASTSASTTTTTTGGGSPLRVHIVSAHATARLVAIKVSSTKRGDAAVQLLKGSKRLAKASHAVPAKISLRPSRALKPGSYTVRVKVSAGGKTASAKRTVRVR